MSDDDAIVTSSITITRRYWPNREDLEEADTIAFDTEGGPTLIEVLGMLEMAKMHFTAPGFTHDEEEE